MEANGYSHDEEELFKAMQVASAPVLHAVFRAAVELDLFEIMAAKSGPNGYISPSQISSHLPTKNTEAPAMLDRLLRLLASHGILNCTVDSADRSRLYGLTSMCKYFIRDEDGVSISPSFFILHDKVYVESYARIKDAVLEGGIPFNKAHGMPLFEYLGRDTRFGAVFNSTLSGTATRFMKRLLETYQGFENLKTELVVDVGGGIGSALACVVSKYPQIKGINFDLPHVIKEAPQIPGVEHVAGDMFEGVPKAEVILLKRVLHDWRDEECLKILKNCWKALPETGGGKVIVIEMILPELPGTDVKSRNVFHFDVSMLTLTSGGRERTEGEYEGLAKEAGFAASKLVCREDILGVLEFYKL